MSINCSNGGGRADAMFDLRTVGRMRPALHVHVDYPSLKEEITFLSAGSGE
ncbi:unnamed protein product [Penicillium camemberti]|uniref:Str. FM013 n=1 Tax=Penicillium camemberti (strain FM 013) TaxID=1429867 RepID=A0A0G4PB93_PENC3|nr:unnamed protein product [Penicillium camemberti]